MSDHSSSPLKTSRKHTGAVQAHVISDQPESHPDARHAAPETAMLMVDVINAMDFEGNEMMVKDALPAACAMRVLKDRCRVLGIPVIYANDNFGRWRSDMVDITRRVIESSSPGRPVAQLLRPDSEDYFVVKPKHSAFLSSSLDVLLSYLGTKTIIVCGFAGNVCVLFSANDAHQRDFSVFVPRDCTAFTSPEERDATLILLERVLGADTRESGEMDLERLCGRSGNRCATKDVARGHDGK